MPKKWLLLSLFVILALSVMTYQSNRRHWLPFQFLNTALNRVHEIKISAERRRHLAVPQDVPQGRRKHQTESGTFEASARATALPGDHS